ncbi:MAG: alpha-amylase family glycosyl hydrolase [Ferrimicrobium sp.]
MIEGFKSPSTLWWRGGAIYHVYVRSFADGNGDGVGDLPGLISRLDYLEDLGVDGVWLSPTMPSPNRDWGYDVADYRGVHDEFGTLEDMDRLIAAARKKGIGILLDLVPNHTSSEHPWFVDACSGLHSRYRNYYVWAGPRDDGSAPNNWLDATGASAWTLDVDSGQYYLHNFLPSQPDLNWWNPEVHAEFEKLLRFWFDRGVAGFRIDVAHGLYKDFGLRDDPLAIDMPAAFDHFGLVESFSKNRPEVHDIYRSWRKIADGYEPPRLLLGETWVGEMERLASFYGSDDELNLAFNFPFLFSEFSASALARVVASTLESLPLKSIPVWTLSNHDVSRFATRWASDREDKTRLALAILLTLPGTVVLYYGDELGLGDVEVALEDQKDEMTSGVSGIHFQRDSARTPMPWSSDPGQGFVMDDVTPWLPFGEHNGKDVASQLSDKTSTLNLCKELLQLRRQSHGSSLSYEEIPSAEGVWHYRVGDVIVFANFTDQPEALKLAEPLQYLSSKPDKSWVRASSSRIEVDPWEAIVWTI